MAATNKPAAKAAIKDERVSVEFIKPYGRYSRGDIAGFEPDEAKRLVEGVKVAVKPGTGKDAEEQ